jgi:hypothetical protein
MTTINFDNELQLLSEIPNIPDICYVESYFPDTLTYLNTNLCVEIDLSPIVIYIKNNEGVLTKLNNGLQRCHVLYFSNKEEWLPCVLPHLKFWIKSSKNNQSLYNFLKKYED